MAVTDPRETEVRREKLIGKEGKWRALGAIVVVVYCYFAWKAIGYMTQKFFEGMANFHIPM